MSTNSKGPSASGLLIGLTLLSFAGGGAWAIGTCDWRPLAIAPLLVLALLGGILALASVVELP